MGGGIAKIFALFDDDKTQTISLKNLTRVAKELGETMTTEELREMIERADSNGDGEISLDDFYTIIEEDFPVRSAWTAEAGLDSNPADLREVLRRRVTVAGLAPCP